MTAIPPRSGILMSAAELGWARSLALLGDARAAAIRMRLSADLRDRDEGTRDYVTAVDKLVEELAALASDGTTQRITRFLAGPSEAA